MSYGTKVIRGFTHAGKSIRQEGDTAIFTAYSKTFQGRFSDGTAIDALHQWLIAKPSVGDIALHIAETWRVGLEGSICERVFYDNKQVYLVVQPGVKKPRKFIHEGIPIQFRTGGRAFKEIPNCQGIILYSQESECGKV